LRISIIDLRSAAARARGTASLDGIEGVT